MITDRCWYDCPFHKGPIEWHHPISTTHDCGMSLCQAHHSIIQGRKILYQEELNLGLTIDKLWHDLKNLEADAVIDAGYSPAQIDKK